MEELERDNSLKALRDLCDKCSRDAKSGSTATEDTGNVMSYFTSCTVCSPLSFTQSLSYSLLILTALSVHAI